MKETEEPARRIVFYGRCFHDFYAGQLPEAREKIDFVLKQVAFMKRIPVQFFKKITGSAGLWEIRIEYNNNIYRVFCCFDEGKLVVLFNGFQKKTQKTPSKEIERAKRLMGEYLDFAERMKTKQ